MWNEEFRPVVGFEEEYLVGNRGTVVRLKYRHGERKGYETLEGTGPTGIRFVTLVKNAHDKTRRNIRVQRRVQELVCEAFHGPKPSRNHEVHVCGTNKCSENSSVLCWRVKGRERAGKARLAISKVPRRPPGETSQLMSAIEAALEGGKNIAEIERMVAV